MSPIDYLYGRLNYERVNPAVHKGAFRLQRMRHLLAHLDFPQRTAPILHVGGTKGKGSTCNMLASMLLAAGKKVGLYTSPHLERLEERFRVDGLQCTGDQLVKLVEIVRVAADRVEQQGEGPPTFFELTTAMAMVHFQREACDCVVLEVGLGGRLDSTNVCEPVVSVITSVGLDHQHILGNTYAEIAFEKAGIIKPGVPIVSGVREPSAAEVVRRVASERGALLWQIGRDFEVECLPPAVDDPSDWGTRWNLLALADGVQPRTGWRVALEGAHQAHNAAVAVATMDVLARSGMGITGEEQQQGLCRVQCDGRIERFGTEPEILLDTAHNVDSIKALLEVLRNRPVAGKTVVVFGTSADKDAEDMLAMLVDVADPLILTRYWSNPRWFDPNELARMCPLTNQVVLPQPQEAFAAALNSVGADGRVVICGSFFLAAELRPILRSRQATS